jgi:hypothetical protein
MKTKEEQLRELFGLPESEVCQKRGKRGGADDLPESVLVNPKVFLLWYRPEGPAAVGCLPDRLQSISPNGTETNHLHST